MEENKKTTRKRTSSRAPRAKKVELTLENLKNIQETQQVLDMLIEDIDENLNMVGKVGKDVKAQFANEYSDIISQVIKNNVNEERLVYNSDTLSCNV